MNKMYIGLAITAHDPSLCIIDEKGNLIFAEASERYYQVKQAYGCRADDLFLSLELIEKYYKLGSKLVISFNWNERILKSLHNLGWTQKLLIWFAGEEVYDLQKMLAASTNIYSGANITFALQRLVGHSIAKKSIHYQYNDHHLTHAASACYSSIFTEAACAVIDGVGEGKSVSFYSFKDGNLRDLHAKKSIIGQGSLGYFYATICQTCGFENLKGEEWKVMGLASYGKFNDTYYSWLRNFFKIDGLYLKITSQSRNVLSQLDKMTRKKDIPALEYADFAYTAQFVFAEYLTGLLNNFYKICPSDNLVLSGGCILNSSYVGTIRQSTPFKNIYVLSAPGDDGTSVGAAYLAYYKDHPYMPRKDIQLPYLGSVVTNKSFDHLKQFSNLHRESFDDFGKLAQFVARLISEGKIIGWVQGRAEFGPRALGNRSILADPRDANIKERLNAEVKFREEFRPFAPSILHEFGNEYFEDYQESPYMERTLVFKKEVRNKVPGVVHVDGTGRLQTVKHKWNERYYDLIKAFYDITQIPILLNTSFNVMGKPIINSVEDAVSVFLTSGMDVLVIENEVILKGP